MTAASRRLNGIETELTTLAGSEAEEKAASVARADDNDAVALEELVRRAEFDEGVLKGPIKTIVRESERQQIQVTSIVNELSSKSQVSADAANAL